MKFEGIFTKITAFAVACVLIIGAVFAARNSGTVKDTPGSGELANLAHYSFCHLDEGYILNAGDPNLYRYPEEYEAIMFASAIALALDDMFDNYNPTFLDSIMCTINWSKGTLEKHKPYIYAMLRYYCSACDADEIEQRREELEAFNEEWRAILPAYSFIPSTDPFIDWFDYYDNILKSGYTAPVWPDKEKYRGCTDALNLAFGETSRFEDDYDLFTYIEFVLGDVLHLDMSWETLVEVSQRDIVCYDNYGYPLGYADFFGNYLPDPAIGYFDPDTNEPVIMLVKEHSGVNYNDVRFNRHLFTDIDEYNLWVNASRNYLIVQGIDVTADNLIKDILGSLEDIGGYTPEWKNGRPVDIRQYLSGINSYKYEITNYDWANTDWADEAAEILVGWDIHNRLSAYKFFLTSGFVDYFNRNPESPLLADVATCECAKEYADKNPDTPFGKAILDIISPSSAPTDAPAVTVVPTPTSAPVVTDVPSPTATPEVTPAVSQEASAESDVSVVIPDNTSEGSSPTDIPDEPSVTTEPSDVGSVEDCPATPENPDDTVGATDASTGEDDISSHDTSPDTSLDTSTTADTPKADTVDTAKVDTDTSSDSSDVAHSSRTWIIVLCAVAIAGVTLFVCLRRKSGD